MLSWCSNPKCIRDECACRRAGIEAPVTVRWHPPQKPTRGKSK